MNRLSLPAAVLTVVLLCAPPAGLAQTEPCDGPGLPLRAIDLDGRPQAVEVADVDNDGDLDVIVFGRFSDQTGVLVLRQQADGAYGQSFFPDGSLAQGPELTDVEVADLDGDGFVDLCAIGDDDRLAVLLNDGAGGFVSILAPLVTNANPANIVTTDVDGDGAVDIVVTCYLADSINVFHGDGSGGFGPAEVVPTAFHPSAIELADYDQDGRLDLILLGWEGWWVMTSQGDGTFSEPEFLHAYGRVALDATIADMNNDGLWDIVIDRHGALMFIQQPDGTFEESRPSDERVWYDYSVVGDFDDDGHLDLVAMENYEFVILLGAGDLRFEARRHRVTHPGVDGLVAGDIDNDGDLDIIAIQDLFDHYVCIHPNEGSGWFTPFETAGSRRTGDLLGSTSVESADLDGDPFIDFIVGEQDADRISVYRNRGDGRSFLHSVVGVGRRPRDVAAGDLDGDGFEDIVSANEYSDDVSVLRNTSRGEVFAEYRVPAGNGPVAIELGDVDDDGDLDAVVAAISSNAVQVLLNDGTGVLDQAGSFPTGVRPIDVKLSDVDGDGVLDCLVANEFHDDVSVLIGRGDGTFWNQQRFHAGDKPVSLACGDIDGDGAADAVVALENDCSVVLMFGDGAGGFEARTTLPAGAGLRDARLFDADGDRDLDLVVASFDAHGSYTFRNDGNGGFEAFALIYTQLGGEGGGESPWAFADGDFDGDGALDLVSGNGPAGSFTVMFNRIDQQCVADLDGDGTLTIFDFLSFQNLFDAGDPTADFDGDGALTIFDFLAFQNAFDVGCM